MQLSTSLPQLGCHEGAPGCTDCTMKVTCLVLPCIQAASILVSVGRSKLWLILMQYYLNATVVRLPSSPYMSLVHVTATLWKCAENKSWLWDWLVAAAVCPSVIVVVHTVTSVEMYDYLFYSLTYPPQCWSCPQWVYSINTRGDFAVCIDGTEMSHQLIHIDY